MLDAPSFDIKVGSVHSVPTKPHRHYDRDCAQGVYRPPMVTEIRSVERVPIDPPWTLRLEECRGRLHALTDTERS